MKFTRLDSDHWQAGEYRIERWRARDCCGVHLQYAASYRGDTLGRYLPETLEEAKKRCAQHAELEAVRALRKLREEVHP